MQQQLSTLQNSLRTAATSSDGAPDSVVIVSFPAENPSGFPQVRIASAWRSEVADDELNGRLNRAVMAASMRAGRFLPRDATRTPAFALSHLETEGLMSWMRHANSVARDSSEAIKQWSSQATEIKDRHIWHASRRVAVVTRGGRYLHCEMAKGWPDGKSGHEISRILNGLIVAAAHRTQTERERAAKPPDPQALLDLMKEHL
ncbi:MAG: hypothetical protein L0G99_11190 [Propionibacteriales bacterium]|nr:hypothetical protein [Propionibacteriales bacterium]